MFGEVYAGTVKPHMCKRHISIDAGFKQTEHVILLHVIQWGKN